MSDKTRSVLRVLGIMAILSIIAYSLFLQRRWPKSATVGMESLSQHGTPDMEPWKVIKSEGDTGQLMEANWILPKWDTNMRLVLAVSSTSRLKNITESIYQEIEKLDSIINEYDPCSEAGRLRRHQILPGQPVSPELFHILQVSLEVSEQSKGAFDITVGRLVQLWKNCQVQKRLPTPEETREARASVGWKLIKLDTQTRQVIVENPAVLIDLGAISKGYATDYLAVFLQSQGISSGLVDIGGEIKVFGERLWKIGIQDPLCLRSAPTSSVSHSVRDEDKRGQEARAKHSDSLPPIGIISIRNMAVATSGHYHRHYEIDGQKYSHIVDPRTCFPVPWKIISATVLMRDGIRADAYATAICILTLEKSMQLAAEQNFETFVIVQSDSGLLGYTTPGFAKYWLEKPKIHIEIYGK